MTRTYSMANVVVVPVPFTEGLPEEEHFGQKVFVQDFSFDTDNEEARIWCEGILDCDHIRSFKSMHDASVFLFEQGAVIDRLIVLHLARKGEKVWKVRVKYAQEQAATQSGAQASSEGKP